MGATSDVASVRIALATSQDLDEIMAIERSSFATPWTAESIADEIARPWSIFRVLRNGDGQLCAYLNFWVIYDKLHVLNIATHPDHRRRGYALTLMEELITEAQKNAVTEIELEVRRTNEEAQRLYESLRFTRIGLHPGYYGDSGEDAIKYALRIPPSVE